MRKRIPVLLAIVLVPASLLIARGATQTPQAPAAAAQRPAVFVVIYERGSAWDAAKGAFEQSSIPEHMQFLRANAEKLVGAAPFQQGIALGSTDRVVGMVIVAATDQEEAQQFIAGDPAVAANVMKATVRRWLVDRVKGY